MPFPLAAIGLIASAAGTAASAMGAKNRKNPTVENKPISVPVSNFLNSEANKLSQSKARDQVEYNQAKGVLDQAYADTGQDFDYGKSLIRGFRPGGSTRSRLFSALDQYEKTRKQAADNSIADSIKSSLMRLRTSGQPGGLNSMTERSLAGLRMKQDDQIASDIAARRYALEQELLNKELSSIGLIEKMYADRASQSLGSTNLQQMLEDYYINRAGQISQGISGNTQTIIKPPKPSNAEILGAALPQLGSTLMAAAPLMEGGASNASYVPFNQVDSYNGEWGSWSNGGV